MPVAVAMRAVTMPVLVAMPLVVAVAVATPVLVGHMRLARVMVIAVMLVRVRHGLGNA